MFAYLNQLIQEHRLIDFLDLTFTFRPFDIAKVLIRIVIELLDFDLTLIVKHLELDITVVFLPQLEGPPLRLQICNVLQCHGYSVELIDLSFELVITVHLLISE